jgi:hypothetical protein
VMMVAFQVTISPHPSVFYAFDVEPEVAMYASPSMLFFFLNSHRGRCPSATFDFAQVIPYVHHASSSSKCSPVAHKRLLYRSVRAPFWHTRSRSMHSSVSAPGTISHYQALLRCDLLGECAVRCMQMRMLSQPIDDNSKATFSMMKQVPEGKSRLETV